MTRKTTSVEELRSKGFQAINDQGGETTMRTLFFYISFIRLLCVPEVYDD